MSPKNAADLARSERRSKPCSMLCSRRGRPSRALPSALGLAVALAAAAPLHVAAQHSGWTARTSDGQPDLQGYWTNNTVVPLQRPPELGNKAFYTEDEAIAYMRGRIEPQETEAGTTEDVHYQLTDFGLDHSQTGVVFNTRTSLIVDPPNGRLPPVLPAADAKAKERAEYQRVHAFDSAQDRSLTERCIVWSHQGPPIIPVGYNSNLKILQSPGYVVIVTEMMPDPRIVPLDGRPHLTGAVRQWLGDSTGRWEGDVLVVETTNFTGNTSVSGVSRTLPLSEDARVVERFERIDEDTIRYRFTVEDPNTWETAWSAEYPMQKIEGPMFEYACHEGNYGLPNTLSGARAEERAAVEAASRGSK